MKYLCVSRPLVDTMISVERVPVTKCVQVHNVDSDFVDTLQSYLENTRRSGGGEVVEVFEIKEEEKYALVEMRETTGENTVYI